MQTRGSKNTENSADVLCSWPLKVSSYRSVQAERERGLAAVGDGGGAGDAADGAEAGPGHVLPVAGARAQQGGQEPGQPPLQGQGGQAAEL